MVDIFGTLGPACDNEEVLTAMFREGMTGIRINLSHVMLKDCVDSIDRIQRAAKACGITPKILIDMQGPELRIGDLKSPMILTEGDIISLVSVVGDTEGAQHGQNKEVCVEPTILRALAVGQEVLLDDGKILAQVTGAATSENTATLRIFRGGVLNSRKSIAIKGESIADMPALTGRDKENLRLAPQLGITGVMQPFVRSAEDLKELRNALNTGTKSTTGIYSGNTGAAKSIRIYAKIENLAGVENLENFFPYADEIIIARGDLGNAMPLWELPGVQKSISKTCRRHNMPFMVVTQMLSSMEHSKVPTRAEVSDIYNAVADGASSVMVTGETAVGENPVEVIRYLSRTAAAAVANIN